jgi:hypothetical protein
MSENLITLEKAFLKLKTDLGLNNKALATLFPSGATGDVRVPIEKFSVQDSSGNLVEMSPMDVLMAVGEQSKESKKLLFDEKRMLIKEPGADGQEKLLASVEGSEFLDNDPTGSAIKKEHQKKLLKMAKELIKVSLSCILYSMNSSTLSRRLWKTLNPKRPNKRGQTSQRARELNPRTTP